MAEILGIGVTHYTGIIAPDQNMAGFLRRTLRSEGVPREMKDPTHWPGPMQAEWGSDGGAAAATQHRAAVVDGFRRIRQEIEAFRPDFLLVWGDDQYENFREDGVPPFCIYIFDDMECRPLLGITSWAGTAENVWGESPDSAFHIRGHADGARYLVRRLLEHEFDVSYAYATRSQKGLAHSFAQTMLFLDYHRTGIATPIVPFHVNCYGSLVVKSKGVGAHITREGMVMDDPPAPTPARCFAIGQETARILRASPWRVVLMGSSSWSHAFLTEKHHWLYPDHEADRQRLAELRANEFSRWQDLDPRDLERSGQHEFLNWVCLAGAMTELGYQAEVTNYVETYVFNSDKCFAIFRPAST